MTAVGNAITAVCRAVQRIGVAFARVRTITGGIRLVSPAMGPCVITTDRDAICRSAIDVQDQAVILLDAAVIELVEEGDVLAILRPLETEPPALVRIACRRAWTGCCETELAGRAVAWNIDRGVQCLK